MDSAPRSHRVRRLEHLRQPKVERVDAAVGSALGLERRGPGADVRGPDGRHRYGLEVRLDDLDVYLGLTHRRLRPRAVAGQPLVTPLPDRQPGVLGRHVVTARQRSELAVGPLLRIDFRLKVRECSRPALSTYRDRSAAPCRRPLTERRLCCRLRPRPACASGPRRSRAGSATASGSVARSWARLTTDSVAAPGATAPMWRAQAMPRPWDSRCSSS